CGEKGVCTVSLTSAGPADPLFAGIASSFTTFQWHDDSFELPPGATHLAGSGVCPVQAFRHGRSWGVQFHPEVDAAIVECWARHEPQKERERLVSFFSAAATGYDAPSRKLLENFLQAMRG
ncbi:MAG TPA: type 1 glutamine amidotransferase, partial [Verrucomicrobiae bacterium]|nr:type 1 glutamine amidotransferase [Verrucomicrobiae bacterium]